MKKRRVSVQLDEDMYLILVKLADLNGQSLSKTIGEYLDIARESFRATAQTIEAARALSEEHQRKLRHRLDLVAAAAQEMADNALELQLDTAADLAREARELEDISYHIRAEVGDQLDREKKRARVAEIGSPVRAVGTPTPDLVTRGSRKNGGGTSGEGGGAK